MRGTEQHGEVPEQTLFQPSDQEIEAVASFTFSRTKPLRDMKTRAPGSCVCITLGGRWFLATAGHLLKDANPIEVVPSEGHRPIDLTKAKRSYHVPDPVDLGVVELTSEQAGEIGALFLDAGGIRASLDTSQAHTVLITGFPLANEFTQGGRRASCGQVSIVTTIPSGDFAYDIGFVPDHTRDVFMKLSGVVRRHYVGPGDPIWSAWEGDWPAQDPGGLSGGGVWLAALAQRKGTGVLHPYPRLLAIQVGYFRRAGVLRAVSIRYWLDLLRNECPDLRPEIARIMDRKGT